MHNNSPRDKLGATEICNGAVVFHNTSLQIGVSSFTINL
jgi:hypothetical protein